MEIRKVFCVIDPTTNSQPALVRGAEIAGNAKAALHAYVCIPETYQVPVESRAAMCEAETARHEAWLAAMLAPLREKGLTVSHEVECQDDWRAAQAPAAKRAGADIIIKASYRRSNLQRRLMKTADWTLLRGAHCPVLFVKDATATPTDKVLAAVNLNAKDPAHQALNEAIIDACQLIAKTTGAELHAVNAYDGEDNFVHPPDLAKKLGIPRERAHVADAPPEDLVPEIAAKLGNPLLVTGSVARRGAAAAVVGNTAERILDKINGEVFVLIHPAS